MLLALAVGLDEGRGHRPGRGQAALDLVDPGIGRHRRRGNRDEGDRRGEAREVARKGHVGLRLKDLAAHWPRPIECPLNPRVPICSATSKLQEASVVTRHRQVALAQDVHSDQDLELKGIA